MWNEAVCVAVSLSLSVALMASLLLSAHPGASAVKLARWVLMILLIYQIKRTHWLIIDLHLPWLVPLAGMAPIKNPLETHSRRRDDGWKWAQRGIEEVPAKCKHDWHIPGWCALCHRSRCRVSVSFRPLLVSRMQRAYGRHKTTVPHHNGHWHYQHSHYTHSLLENSNWRTG